MSSFMKYNMPADHNIVHADQLHTMESQTITTANQISAHLLELERCPDVWFTDGNCVLQAEDMLFKVYTGVLSKYSPFFETLFGLPQPEAGPGSDIGPLQYEGVPLIVLHDGAVDMRYFLKALFDLQ